MIVIGSTFLLPEMVGTGLLSERKVKCRLEKAVEFLSQFACIFLSNRQVLINMADGFSVIPAN